MFLAVPLHYFFPQLVSSSTYQASSGFFWRTKGHLARHGDDTAPHSSHQRTVNVFHLPFICFGITPVLSEKVKSENLALEKVSVEWRRETWLSRMCIEAWWLAALPGVHFQFLYKFYTNLDANKGKCLSVLASHRARSQSYRWIKDRPFRKVVPGRLQIFLTHLFFKQSCKNF